MILLSGALLVDKPSGPTSHDIVGQIRRAAGIRRVGHAGTLDPFASGLLLVLLGPATRLSEYLLGMEKDYEATLRLGVETTSHDPEGEIVSENPEWKAVRKVQFTEAMEAFVGRISQRPPRYSAKKVDGESAHRRVRRGESVELKPVEVEVHSMEILSFDPPDVRLRVRCSSGTYIRALARDLGRSLGVGAHLSALRRTGIGSFSIGAAFPPEAFSDPVAIQDHLLPPAEALAHFPSFVVGPAGAARIRQGQFLSVSEAGIGLPEMDLPDQAPLRVLLDGELVAVAARYGEEIRPKKVLAEAAEVRNG